MRPNATRKARGGTRPKTRTRARTGRPGSPIRETPRAAGAPPAPGRDDGAVGVGPRPEAVADDERHQDVEWADGEQDGECGHDQRDPDPGLRAGLAVPLAGPARRSASGRTADSSAFACSSRSVSRISGRIDVYAG